MGRSALVIKTAELQACVSKLEATRTFENIGLLCEAIEATDWARNIRNEKHVIRGLSAQVAGREIKARGIILQTKAGHRGRVAGQPIVKRSRSEKAKGLKLGKYPEALRGEVSSERYEKLVDLTLEGNVVAACKLKCAACMGYTGAEKACDGGLGGTPCPLYVINRMIFAKRLGFEPNKKTGFYELVKAAVESEVS